jgi:hypothetical protein
MLHGQTSLDGGCGTPRRASSLADLGRSAIIGEDGLSVATGEGVGVVWTHFDIGLLREVRLGNQMM